MKKLSAARTLRKATRTRPQYDPERATPEFRLRERAVEIARRWRIYDPRFKGVLRDAATDLGLDSWHEVKVHALMRAVWQLRRENELLCHLCAVRPFREYPSERQAIALAERELRAEAPLPLLREAPPPATVEAYVLDDSESEDWHLEPLLEALSPAERTFAQWLIFEPGLTDDERDLELGRQPGYSRQMRRRLRQRGRSWMAA